jgi:hypothetical protein
MDCNWCKKPGKRFRNLPIDDKGHVAPWCQRCPDPRYKPRGKPKPEPEKETEK